MYISLAQQPYAGQAASSLSFKIIHSDTPQSIGLLWTRDWPVAETSI